MLIANPVPADAEIPADEMRRFIGESVEEARHSGIRGKAVTPYLLACLSERTDGESLEANLALLESNARLAGEVAVASAARS